MKAFSIACEEAFHARFKGISFQDDISIHIWREGWAAAISKARLEIDEMFYDLQEKFDEVKNGRQ
jgi:hypothetical protein